MSYAEETDLLYMDDFQAEAENRIRNLMWTVSENYELDTKLDTESFAKSKYISLYDAVKQGAFARFFDRNALGMYIVKKVYYGAEEKALTELAQLCVDTATYPKVAKERPGVPELRNKAFEDLMEHSFTKMSYSLPGKIKIAMMRGYLRNDWHCEKKIEEAVSRIRQLEEADDVMAVIKVTDQLYNTLIDKSFERKHGDLDHVLAVTMEDLQEFNWRDFLDEEVTEAMLEDYLKKVNSQVTSIQ